MSTDKWDTKLNASEGFQIVLLGKLLFEEDHNQHFDDMRQIFADRIKRLLMVIMYGPDQCRQSRDLPNSTQFSHSGLNSSPPAKRLTPERKE